MTTQTKEHGTKKTLRMVAIALLIMTALSIIPATQVFAACDTSNITHETTNTKSCDAGCGLANIWRQNCWDTVHTYHCPNGNNEVYVTYRDVAGSCC